MRVLIDTHVLLRWLMGDPKLTSRGAALLKDPQTVVFYSTASIWELRIKEALGKVTLPSTFAEDLRQEHFEVLSIHPEHAHAVGKLPLHHRDPFDRMLIAQAMLEGLTRLTHDKLLSQYEVASLIV